MSYKVNCLRTMGHASEAYPLESIHHIYNTHGRIGGLDVYLPELYRVTASKDLGGFCG